jgi:hypothetical protein
MAEALAMHLITHTVDGDETITYGVGPAGGFTAPWGTVKLDQSTDRWHAYGSDGEECEPGQDYEKAADAAIVVKRIAEGFRRDAGYRGGWVKDA